MSEEEPAEKRVLLVGEANPWGADPAFALYPEPRGASGDRLCRKIMGLRGGQYLQTFDRADLCPRRWSVRVARDNAYRILAAAPKRKALVLLGAKVRDAFGLKRFAGDIPKALPSGIIPDGHQASVGCPVVLMHHPSGLCQFWNEPDAVERTRAALTQAGVLPIPAKAAAVEEETW